MGERGYVRLSTWRPLARIVCGAQRLGTQTTSESAVAGRKIPAPVGPEGPTTDTYPFGVAAVVDDIATVFDSDAGDVVLTVLVTYGSLAPVALGQGRRLGR